MLLFDSVCSEATQVSPRVRECSSLRQLFDSLLSDCWCCNGWMVSRPHQGEQQLWAGAGVLCCGRDCGRGRRWRRRFDADGSARSCFVCPQPSVCALIRVVCFIVADGSRRRRSRDGWSADCAACFPEIKVRLMPLVSGLCARLPDRVLLPVFLPIDLFSAG